MDLHVATAPISTGLVVVLTQLVDVSESFFGISIAVDANKLKPSEALKSEIERKGEIGLISCWMSC